MRDFEPNARSVVAGVASFGAALIALAVTTDEGAKPPEPSASLAPVTAPQTIEPVVTVPPITEPPTTKLGPVSRSLVVGRSTTTTTTIRTPEPTTSTTAAAGLAMDQPASSELLAEASWYGPGFYGNRTACGQVYTPEIMGVAHKTLPCGTLVTFRHNGATRTVPVIDRGPYTRGRMFDLSHGLCQALNHCFTGTIAYSL